MIFKNKTILFSLSSLSLLSASKECDCDIWFKKLTSSADVVGIFAEKPVTISGIGEVVKDSVGPYGDIFMSLVINNEDRIICSKIIKGDSTLLPKAQKYLSEQTVSSAIVSGKKVYSLYPFRLRFAPYSEKTGKSRRFRRRNQF